MPELLCAGESQFSQPAAREVRHFAGFLAAACVALPGWFQWDVVLLYFTTVALLALGVAIVLQHAPPAASLSEKFVLCGPVFFAMPMAVFGTEHFLDPAGIARLIPKWVPAHIFFTYLVGTCLIAVSLSIVFRKLPGLAAGLTGVMFLFFEALMHIPIAVKVPHNRGAWAVAVRDFSFSCGALSFAATRTTKWRVHGAHWLISAARVCMGGFMIFYGVQHLLHPELEPGVPLRQLTPAFIPFHLLWGYLAGVVYLAGGVFLLIQKDGAFGGDVAGVFCLLRRVDFFCAVHDPAWRRRRAEYSGR